jgi:hypothetical protein
MRGYVAKKGNRWYAVIYDGINPATGRLRLLLHCGTEWHTRPVAGERGPTARSLLSTYT